MDTEGRFMVAVGAIIEDTTTGKVLLLQRSRKADFTPGIWEEITGRMKQFEGLEEALRREIGEESGITEIEVIKPLTVNHFFRGEKMAEKEIVLIIYWCKTSSDKVVIFGEHDNYRWVEPNEALKLVEHPGVKKDIETFIKEKLLLGG